MQHIQTNVRRGLRPLIAGEDLTGKEGLFVKLVNDGGKAKAVLPTSVADEAIYLLVDGNPANADVGILPLSGEQQVRGTAKGSGNVGDVLVLADPGVAGDKGKARRASGAGLVLQPRFRG